MARSFQHLDALALALGELQRNDVWVSVAARESEDLCRRSTALAIDLLPGHWSQPCSGREPLQRPLRPHNQPRLKYFNE